MKEKSPLDQFGSSEGRQEAISTLETEIRRQMEKIDEAYSRLGRRFQSTTEQETAGINEMTDKVVELKQKLRKLREIDSGQPG